MPTTRAPAALQEANKQGGLPCPSRRPRVLLQTAAACICELCWRTVSMQQESILAGLPTGCCSHRAVISRLLVLQFRLTSGHVWRHQRHDCRVCLLLPVQGRCASLQGFKRTSQQHTDVWCLLKVNAGLVDTTLEEIACSAGTAPGCMSLNANMSGHQPCLTMSMPAEAVTCQSITAEAPLWQIGPEILCCH